MQGYELKFQFIAVSTTNTMPSPSKFGKMNNQYKRIVFGYGRSIENQLHNGTIPQYLLFICLAYYYHEDYFDKSGGEIIISNQKRTINRVQYDDPCSCKVFCKLWINCNVQQIAEWTLTIDQVSGDIMPGCLFSVMLMVKNYRTSAVILSNPCAITVADKGDEIKVSLNTKNGLFAVSKCGYFVIKELAEKSNRDNSVIKLIVQLDGKKVCITLNCFKLS